jgi:20S proteasome subunit beta 1
MAITYDGGVMLGADSRTSSGVYVANRVADKIWPISKNIFALKSGSAADTQFLLQTTKNYVAQFAIEYGDLPLVKVATRVLQQFQYEYKDNLSAAVIVCGIDNVEGPQIYSVGIGGTTSKQNIALSGSGSAFIYGYCDTNYKTGMSRQDAKQFIKNAITLSMYRDNSSGGIIRTLDITKEGYSRDYISYNKLDWPVEK